MIDLGAWAAESYRVPDAADDLPDDPSDDASSSSTPPGS
jgi:endogenous inhibitor of DNA gyrase (YacG/DUF329 family)